MSKKKKIGDHLQETGLVTLYRDTITGGSIQVTPEHAEAILALEEKIGQKVHTKDDPNTRSDQGSSQDTQE